MPLTFFSFPFLATRQAIRGHIWSNIWVYNCEVDKRVWSLKFPPPCWMNEPGGGGGGEVCRWRGMIFHAVGPFDLSTMRDSQCVPSSLLLYLEESLYHRDTSYGVRVYYIFMVYTYRYSYVDLAPRAFVCDCPLGVKNVVWGLFTSSKCRMWR